MPGDADTMTDDDLGLREVTNGPRQTRRLPDKILVAFHSACDQSDLQVAESLLGILETMLMRRPLEPGNARRKNMESLVAAHERLWNLRRPVGGH